MATLGTNAYANDIWVTSYWQIYHRLTATVARSGNTISLSNITAYFHLEGSSGSAWAGTNYGPAYFYLQKSGSTISTATSQTWNWSVSAPYSGDVASYSLPDCSFTVGTSDTSATISLEWQGQNSDHNSTSWDLTFPTGGTAPDGGYITTITPHYDSVEMTGGIVSNGTGATQTYVELVALSAPYTGEGIPQRYEGFNTMSATKTITNSSPAASGGITLAPNTLYYAGVYANNGVGVYRYDGGSFITAREITRIVMETTAKTSKAITIASGKGGSASRSQPEISFDDGATWSSLGGTISPSTTSIPRTITGLSPETTYTVKIRIKNVTGSAVSNVETITFTTLPYSRSFYIAKPATGYTVTGMSDGGIFDVTKFNTKLAQAGTVLTKEPSYLETESIATPTRYDMRLYYADSSYITLFSANTGEDFRELKTAWGISDEGPSYPLTWTLAAGYIRQNPAKIYVPEESGGSIVRAEVSKVYLAELDPDTGTYKRRPYWIAPAPPTGGSN